MNPILDGCIPLVLTVREVCSVLRLSRPKVYDLIKDGYLEAFKLGGDWRIVRRSVESYVGPIEAIP